MTEQAKQEPWYCWKNINYVLFNLFIIYLVYDYYSNGTEYARNVLIFWVWLCFIVQVACMVSIEACRSNGTLRKPHFEKLSKRDLPLGEEAFLFTELTVSIFLAGCGMFWLAGINILTALIHSANIDAARR